MFETLTLLTIGIALSMDAFSVSLAIGTLQLPEKKQLLIAGIVGIFHFFMPLLGLLIGDNIIRFLHVSGTVLLSCILLLIAFEMLKNGLAKEEKKFNLNIWGILTLAFSVSFDSFSTGIGLSSITSNIFLATLIFSISSFVFTYLGLILGKYSKKLLGSYASIAGAILLAIIATIAFFA